MISVVMLSGGLDSTGMLIKQLKETDSLVHVHHITLKTCEDRWRAEGKAIEEIISYCRKHYKNFGFSTSTYEFPDFNIGYAGMDIMTVGFIGGNVVRAVQKQFIQTDNYLYDAEVLLGDTKTDFPGGMEELNSTIRITQAKYMFKMQFLDYKSHNWNTPQVSFPLIDYTKKEIYKKYIPDELKQSIWSCRRPVYLDGKSIPCGICHTCQQMEDL